MEMVAMFTYAQSVAAQQPIALPEKVVEGHLPNGLSYYVVRNANPAHGVEMRLVMNVGSVQQTAAQQGVAHFIEHLAFDGTPNFPRRSMVEYWESLGMKFGRDINAFTTHDRTQYMVTLPVDSPRDSCINRSLLALHDWLSGVACQTDMIEKERKIIIEELRGYVIDDDFYALKMGHNRYASNFPLGSIGQIQAIGRSTLLDFYNRWYIPSNATVIVVGDVDPVAVSQAIGRIFSSLPAGRHTVKKKEQLTYRKGVRIHEVCDTIRKRSSLELLIPHRYEPMRDLASTCLRRRQLMLVDAVESRLKARGLKVKVYDSWYLATTNHFSLEFEGDSVADLYARIRRLAMELNDMKEKGWCDEEMRLVRENAVRKCILADPSALTSLEWCDNLTDRVTVGDCCISSPDELQALKQRVQETTSSQLQAILGDFLNAARSRMLLAFRKADTKGETLDAKAVRKAWNAGLHAQALPFRYEPTKRTGGDEAAPALPTPECLDAVPPFQPSQVVSESYLPNLAVTRLQLRNGMNIILRPTRDSSGQFLFQLVGRGGNGDLPDSLARSFAGADGIMEMGGIARVGRDTLSTYLYENNMSVISAIGNYWHEMIGMAPAARSVQFFNYIREKILRPERCRKEYDDYVREQAEREGDRSYLDKMMDTDIARQMTNRLDSLVGNAIVRAPGAVSSHRRYGLDDIADYYTALYADPRATTLVITGDFNVDSLKKEVAAAFASFAVPRKAVTLNDRPFVLPQTPIDVPFEAMNDSITTFDWVMPFHYEPSLSASLELKLMRDLLQNRMIAGLRERAGLAYSPFVGIAYNGIPQRTCCFDLYCTVLPKKASHMRKEIVAIVESLQKAPVSVDELQGLKRSFQVTKRQTLTPEASAAWRSTLVGLIKNGESVDDFDRYDELLDHITPEGLQKRFQEYLDKEKYILLHSGKF